jgi:hypothetical protein
MNMMSKTRKPTGKAVTDEKGNRSWTWTDEDTMDTAQVRSLGEGLSLETGSPADGLPALDPYNSRSSSPADPPSKPAKRRTLDDMRRLSEHIKQTKIWKRGD